MTNSEAKKIALHYQLREQEFCKGVIAEWREVIARLIAMPDEKIRPELTRMLADCDRLEKESL